MTLGRVRAALGSIWAWRWFDLTALGLLVVTVTSLDLVWYEIDGRAPYVDYARHLGDSIAYYHLFSWSHPLRMVTEYMLYPPFVYWVTDLFYGVLGTAQWVAILSNVVFLAILVGATYGIGKTLWSRRTGLLSALFVVTTPLVVSMLETYMLDVPLTAMVAAALYFLIRSDYFAVRRASLLLGLVCGAGILTRVQFVTYFALPGVVAVAEGLRRARSERSARRLLNMAGAGLVALACAGVWVVHNWDAILADSKRNSTFDAFAGGAAFGHPNPLVGSARGVLWYVWNLLDNELYLVPFACLVAGLVYVFRRDESAARNEPLVLTIVGGYIAMTLVRNKDFRFTIPMLPAIAVVGTHWLEYVGRRARRWLTGGLVAYCAVAYVAISFGLPFLPNKIQVSLPESRFTPSLFEFVPPVSPTVTGIVLFAQHGFIYGKPDRRSWDEESIWKTMRALGGERLVYSYDQDTIWFNTWDVRYWDLKYGLTWVATPDQADFVVLRLAGNPPAPPGFRLLSTMTLPDGEVVRLYARGT